MGFIVFGIIMGVVLVITLSMWASRDCEWYNYIAAILAVLLSIAAGIICKEKNLEPVILFVLENSPYKQAGFDCYDKQRNALTYTGHSPVVAHPPCQLWGKMAKINYIRWGGEHNKPGNDGGCFKFALDTVNRCGGVLEHPAQSYAWQEYGLIKPRPNQWTPSGGGWTCEVWQSAYGHKANKKTWLYYKGKSKPKDPLWDRPKGTHQIGFYDQRGKERNKPTLSKYEANATPQAFMDYLVELAREA